MDMTGRADAALRAIAILKGRLTGDDDAVLEIVTAELQATVAIATIRELEPTATVETIRAEAQELADAHRAAHEIYIGMMEVASTLLDLLSKGHDYRALEQLDAVERHFRGLRG